MLQLHAPTAARTAIWREDLLRQALKARAQAFVDARLLSRALTPSALADGLHISRSALYRLFDVEGGVARYIQHRRLEDARLALQRGDPRQIATLAYDYGFLSEAHFCRAFRRRFGLTPSEARRHGAAPLPLDGMPVPTATAAPL